MKTLDLMKPRIVTCPGAQIRIAKYIAAHEWEHVDGVHCDRALAIAILIAQTPLFWASTDSAPSAKETASLTSALRALAADLLGSEPGQLELSLADDTNVYLAQHQSAVWLACHSFFDDQVAATVAAHGPRLASCRMT